jgi:transcriptional regulator with XRE-family HTH domain
MTWKADFGRYVRERRESLGITAQEELGAMIGRDQNWVSRLERGVIRCPIPPPEEINLLATALQVTPFQLLRQAGYGTEQDGDGWDTASGMAHQVYEARRLLGMLGQQLSDVIRLLEEPDTYVAGE